MADSSGQERSAGGRVSVRLRSREDLVAAVPHLLGFHPEDSLVIVCVAGDGPVLRIDEPTVADEVPDVAEALVAPFREQGFGRGGIALVHFTSERDEHLTLNEALVAQFTAECGLVPVVMLHVSEDGIRDLDSGEVMAPEAVAAARSRMAAEFAFAGKPQPRPGRSSYALELEANPAEQVGVDFEIASVEPALRARLGTHTGRAGERDWVLAAVASFVDDPVPMSRAAVARLLLDLDEPDIRNGALLAIKRADAHRHVALWEDLSRRAPDAQRAAPVALLAMSHWVAGDGAAAWTAIEATEAMGRGHPLADLASNLLTSATPPMRWDAVQAALATAARHSTQSVPNEAIDFRAVRGRIMRHLSASVDESGNSDGPADGPLSRPRPFDGPTP